MPDFGSACDAHSGRAGFGKFIRQYYCRKTLGADALASVSLGNAVFFSIFVLALGFRLLFRRWFQKRIQSRIIIPSILFSAMVL
jgi:hypothetical protein